MKGPQSNGIQVLIYKFTLRSLPRPLPLSNKPVVCVNKLTRRPTHGGRAWSSGSGFCIFVLAVSHVPVGCLLLCVFVPLDGPVHDVVEKDHGGSDVEDLAAESAPAVEDGGVGGAGQGVLSVGAQAVGDDAALLGAACGNSILSAFMRPGANIDLLSLSRPRSISGRVLP